MLSASIGTSGIPTLRSQGKATLSSFSIVQAKSVGAKFGRPRTVPIELLSRLQCVVLKSFSPLNFAFFFICGLSIAFKKRALISCPVHACSSHETTSSKYMMWEYAIYDCKKSIGKPWTKTVRVPWMLREQTKMPHPIGLWRLYLNSSPAIVTLRPKVSPFGCLFRFS